MVRRLSSLIWQDDPSFLHNLEIQPWGLSRPVRAGGMQQPRVWLAGTALDRRSIHLHWVSVDGRHSGGSSVSQRWPLGGVAVASGDYVAVGSLLNIPFEASVGFFDVTGDEPAEIGRLPLLFDGSHDPCQRIAAGAASTGRFYLLVEVAQAAGPSQTVLRVVGPTGHAGDHTATVPPPTDYRWAAPPGVPLSEVTAVDVAEPGRTPQFLFYAKFKDHQLRRYTPITDAGAGSLDVETAPPPLTDDLTSATAWGTDDTGAIWLYIPGASPSLHVWQWPLGSAAATRVSLPLPGDAPTARPTAIRVSGDDVLLRVEQAFGADAVTARMEVCRRYQRAAGDTGVTEASPPVIYSNHTILQVSLGGPETDPPQWNAGATVSVSATGTEHRDGMTTPIAPSTLKAWAIRWGSAQSEPWQLTLDANGNGTLTVSRPPGTELPDPGLYRVTLTSDRLAPGVSEHDSSYRVALVVEVLSAEAFGPAPLLVSGASADDAPRSRSAFAAGETIPFRLPATPEAGAAIQLLDIDGQILAVSPLTGNTASLSIPAWLTSTLLPGKYKLRLTEPAASVLPGTAEFTLGPATRRSGFAFIEHGDMVPVTARSDTLRLAGGFAVGDAGMSDIPDHMVAAVAAARARRAARRGTTLIMERIGESQSFDPQHELQQVAGELRQAAEAMRPTTPVPWPPTPYLLHVVDRLGLEGIGYLAIAVPNDAYVTVGAGGQFALFTLDDHNHDHMAATMELLRNATKALQCTATFLGWCWAANWWTDDAQLRANLAESDSRTPAVLRRFAEAVAGVAERPLVTAAPGPFRNPCAWPPVTFADVPGALLQPVQRVDLHLQVEQTPWPFVTSFAVDFYARPGKPVLAHPDLWTDRGTGELLLPALLSSWGRGADAVGLAPYNPPWGRGTPDPRLAYQGFADITRSLSGLLQTYGGWWVGLTPLDRVAILARRSSYVEPWNGLMASHFADVMHAHTACLYAQHPARIMFDEDLLAGRVQLDDIDVLLLVGERAPLEPPLAGLLAAAEQRTGPRGPLRILCDGGCDQSLATRYQLLTRPPGPTHPGGEPLAFNGFRGLGPDEYQYWTLRDTVGRDAADLAVALDALTPPPVKASVPGLRPSFVAVHARGALAGRYLLVVDDSPIPLPPAQLWRVTVRSATRMPSVATVDLRTAPGEVVYDVFAGTIAEPLSHGYRADLRQLPARLFAVLPAAVESVRLTGPTTVTVGGRLTAQVSALDRDHRLIAASVPIRVSLAVGDTVVHEEVLHCCGAAVPITLRVPLRTTGYLSLRAEELFTGRGARLPISVRPAPSPIDMSMPEPVPAAEPPSTTVVSGSSHSTWEHSRPSERLFGPHAKDVAVTRDGRLAVAITTDWGENVYAVDTTTGVQRWTGSVGQYTGFEVSSAGDGVAVTGFAFTNRNGFDAEGYRLHLFDATGTAVDAITGYGLPRRACHWFRPDYPMSSPDCFAISPDATRAASAGNLGVVLWQRQHPAGWEPLWVRQAPDRQVRTVAVTGDCAILAEDGYLLAIDSTAEIRWQFPLPKPDSSLRQIVLARDNPTRAALLTTAFGGQVLLCNGTPDLATGRPEITGVVTQPVDHLSLSHDGQALAVTWGTELRVYDGAGQLLWSLPADDMLGEPRFSDDDTHIAVHSHLGTLYCAAVADGTVALVDETRAVSSTCWLPDGDLILTTWHGDVARLPLSGTSAGWSARLRPQHDQQQLLGSLARGAHEAARIPLPRSEPSTATLSSPLLSDKDVIVEIVGGIVLTDYQIMGALHNQPAPPPPPQPQPLLPWTKVNYIATEGDQTVYLHLDFWNREVQLDSVSLTQDGRLPESLLREAELQYWNRVTDQWIPHCSLLFDLPTSPTSADRPTVEQTCRFPAAPPVAAAPLATPNNPPPGSRRFRLALPWGLVTNLYLTRIQVNGVDRGCSHPDVRAGGVDGKSMVRLFDSRLRAVPGNANAFLVGARAVYDAQAGAVPGCPGYLALDGPADPHGLRLAQPVEQLQMNGKTIADWDFAIVSPPTAAGFRWIQFAWRALADGLTAFTLRFGSDPSLRLGWNLVVGDSIFPGEIRTDVQVTGNDTLWTVASQAWHYVRVDLSRYPLQGVAAVDQSHVRGQGMFLASVGAPVAVDQIVLAATRSDLPEPLGSVAIVELP